MSLNESICIVSEDGSLTGLLRSMDAFILCRMSEGNEFYTEWTESYDSFDQMNLRENLLRGIYAYGFEKPSAIQQKGIVPFAKGLDVIQQAQSGTGKTATFCAGILEVRYRLLLMHLSRSVLPFFLLSE